MIYDLLIVIRYLVIAIDFTIVSEFKTINY